MGYMFEIEENLYKKKFKNIVGLDEVGRGPLAGNVVACAVIMPLDEKFRIVGIQDSKKLTAKKREYLVEKIKEVAIDYAICESSVEEIDSINILNATKKAMLQCLQNLKVAPDYLLIDGNFLLQTDIPQECVVRGDSRSYSIAAASILAKVYRDNQMQEIAKLYPEYSFEKHKGYGTRIHIEAIKKYGLCKIHRKTFTKKILDNLEKIKR